MTLPKHINDREQQKFESAGLGKAAIRTVGGLVQASFDRVDVTYPSAVSEAYAFSFESVTVATITVTYTDSTKDNLLSAVKS